MNNQNILLCGLPSSGKTTFIAALWYQLFNKEISTILPMGDRLPSNREYLNDLSNKWCRFQDMARTRISEEKEVELYLKNGKEEFKLRVPDMSGETWENIWIERTCKTEVQNWVKDSSGIILFLHADNITPAVSILSAKEMSEEIDETKMDEAETESSETESQAAPWNPKESPTQIVLIDILQSLSTPPLSNGGHRLAIIISAWDKAADTEQSPKEYLTYHLPMLSQYLKNNSAFKAIKIFGVSALGGDLEVNEDLTRLKRENTPSNRVTVTNGDVDNNDLTIPIHWLLN